MPIGELSDWHLMVACDACRADRILAVRNLVELVGPDQKLVTLVPRLRCREAACRRPPSQVRLRSKFPIHPGPEMIEVLIKAPDRHSPRF